jgi:hypothetical protein
LHFDKLQLKAGCVPDGTKSGSIPVTKHEKASENFTLSNAHIRTGPNVMQLIFGQQVVNNFEHQFDSISPLNRIWASGFFTICRFWPHYGWFAGRL